MTFGFKPTDAAADPRLLARPRARGAGGRRRALRQRQVHAGAPRRPASTSRGRARSCSTAGRATRSPARCWPARWRWWSSGSRSSPAPCATTSPCGTTTSATRTSPARPRDAQIHDDILGRAGGYDSRHGGRRGQLERRAAAAPRDRPGPGAQPVAPRARRGDQRARPRAPRPRSRPALRRRGCTTLVVAHRLSTVRDADLILVHGEGRGRRARPPRRAGRPRRPLRRAGARVSAVRPRRPVGAGLARAAGGHGRTLLASGEATVFLVDDGRARHRAPRWSTFAAPGLLVPGDPPRRPRAGRSAAASAAGVEELDVAGPTPTAAGDGRHRSTTSCWPSCSATSRRAPDTRWPTWPASRLGSRPGRRPSWRSRPGSAPTSGVSQRSPAISLPEAGAAGRPACRRPCRRGRRRPLRPAHRARHRRAARRPRLAHVRWRGAVVDGAQDTRRAEEVAPGRDRVAALARAAEERGVRAAGRASSAPIRHRSSPTAVDPFVVAAVAARRSAATGRRCVVPPWRARRPRGRRRRACHGSRVGVLRPAGHPARTVVATVGRAGCWASGPTAPRSPCCPTGRREGASPCDRVRRPPSGRPRAASAAGLLDDGFTFRPAAARGRGPRRRPQARARGRPCGPDGATGRGVRRVGGRCSPSPAWPCRFASGVVFDEIVPAGRPVAAAGTCWSPWSWSPWRPLPLQIALASVRTRLEAGAAFDVQRGLGAGCCAAARRPGAAARRRRRGQPAGRLGGARATPSTGRCWRCCRPCCRASSRASCCSRTTPAWPRSSSASAP